MRASVLPEPHQTSGVAALTLLRPRTWAQRLDVTPFLVLYAILAVVAAVGGGGASGGGGVGVPSGVGVDAGKEAAPGTSPETSHFWLLWVAAASAVGLAHLGTLLCEFWWVQFRAKVAWRQVPDLASAQVVLVVPPPHRGSPALCTLQPISASTRVSAVAAASAGDGKGSSATGAVLRQLTPPAVWFDFQHLRYCYVPAESSEGSAVFQKLPFPVRDELGVLAASVGWSGKEVDIAHRVWGLNDVATPLPLFWDLFREHALAPFFVFQVFCVCLWMIDDYWMYSVMTLAMLVGLEVTLVKQRIRNAVMLSKMRTKPQPVQVFRDKRWVKVTSTDLVPGDLISLYHSGKSPAPGTAAVMCPADVLLLKGSCVVNEAMLTGESVPQQKEGIDSLTASEASDPLAAFDTTNRRHVGHVVYGGTELVSHSTHSSEVGGLPVAKGVATGDGGALAVVVRTGMYTSQGDLMRTIQFASDRMTVGNKEAFLFILVLLVFAVCASAYVLKAGIEHGGRDMSKLVLHCVLIIVSVVPPELPMELTMAVNTSLAALMRLGVFCTEPFRIPHAGKVDICCFDKTGTLTSDAVVVDGVSACMDDDGGQHLDDNSVVEVMRAPRAALAVLAGCHAVTKNSADGAFIGDPLEVAVLQSIGWTVLPGGVSKPTPGARHAPGAAMCVFKRWAFDPMRRRMSAAAVGTAEDARGPVKLLCKGAPEAIASVVRGDLPPSFLSTCRHLTLSGHRVLALAHRTLPEGVTREAVSTWSTEQVETDMTFVGFLVLSTPLKVDSVDVIKHLIAAKHSCVMITGDDALTGVAVARLVGIIPETVPNVLLIEASTVDPGSQLELNGDCGLKLSTFAAAPPTSTPTSTGSSGGEDAAFTSGPFSFSRLPKVLAQARAGEVSVAITGAALTRIVKHGPAALRGPVEPIIRDLCLSAVVFARVSPSQKEDIVAAMNSSGKCTLMCGDGTNDVGALKQAHVGVSIISNPAIERQQLEVRKLSRKDNRDAIRKLQSQLKEDTRMVQLGDASIASPFTSKNSSISTTVEIIRQGRCTLVTTHQMYKILAINCLVLSYMLSVLYFYGVKSGDSQSTFVGVGIASLFLLLSWSKPLQHLSPSRPHSSVFNVPLIVSVALQFIIHLYFLTQAVALCVPYLEENPDLDGPFTPNVLNTVVFLITLTMQLSTFAVNYQGHPYMISLWEHKYLWRVLAVLYFIAFLLASELIPDLGESLDLVPLPSEEVRVGVLSAMALDLVAVVVVERSIRWLAGKAGW